MYYSYSKKFWNTIYLDHDMLNKQDKIHITINSFIGLFSIVVTLVIYFEIDFSLIFDFNLSLMMLILLVIFAGISIFFLGKALLLFLLRQKPPVPIPEPKPVPNNLLETDDIFLYEQFERFHQAQAIILLAQAYRITPLILGNIEQSLQERFGIENTYHLVPVAGNTVEPATYFSHLAQQLNLSEKVENGAQFESILDRKLKNGEHLGLLISSLEKGDGHRATELASLLRNLLEHHQLSFHLLFCGGQKLAELRFANGDLSLLNCAAVGYWPELTGPDVQQFYEQAYSEQPSLTDEQAQALLEVSGGHPTLLAHCFDYWAKDQLIETYSQQLQQEDVLVGAFTPFLNKPDLAQQMVERLAKLDICPATPYIYDELLRQLYWANLLVKREGRLVWRCEAILQAGMSILGTMKTMS